MAEHNTIGQLGEQQAVKLLQDKGFKILETNWRLRNLEVDIIAANKEYIVFAEVKTRTSTFAGRPEEAVDLVKRKRLVVAANAYFKYHHETRLIRFDIIGILMDKSHEIVEITHLENAFAPPLRTVNVNSYSGRWRWKHRTKVISR